jgi:hypothetical protein
MFGKTPGRKLLQLSASLLLLTVSYGGGLVGSAEACSVNYWVSPSGNDSNSGSESDPFLTLSAGQQAVRGNKFRGRCTINVNVESGTYALTAALIFDSSDSGSPKAQVVYRAAPGNFGPAIISGGIPVNAFSCSGAICTSRVTGLPAGEMPRQFYVNGGRAIRARSNYGQPVNLNYFRPLDTPTLAPGYVQILPEKFTHPELVEAVTALQWKMMRCPVANLTNQKLNMIKPCWTNANSYSSPNNFQLLSWLENAPEFLTVPNTWYLDPYSQKLTYYNTGSDTPEDGILPVLENLVTLQGTPDSPVRNMTFQGLQFSYATWLEPNTSNGYVSDQSSYILMGTGYLPTTIGHQQITYKTLGNVTLQYARNITFIGNTFTHLGGVGLDLDTGSQNNKVINNTFTDISSTALQVGGLYPEDARPNAAQVTSNNLVQNNTISYTGQDYWDSAGVFLGFTTHTTVTHNTISHTPWSGLAIGWGWGLLDDPSFPGVPTATPNMWGTYNTQTIQSDNKITSNLFDSFAEQLWDVGAIYTNGSQGPNFQHGLSIKLNVAENKRPAAGSNIYYTDGGSQYVTLKQNVSINDPVGTADFGPCTISGIPVLSAVFPLCLGTGVVPYGSDFGGCAPVGHLNYISNYLLDYTNFFEPSICQNPAYMPPHPIDLRIRNKGPISIPSQVPSWILNQAGVQ